MPDDFFRGNGAVVGPVSWFACALLTGRVRSLGLGTTFRAAVGSGAAAGLVGLLVSHSVGLIVGIAAFGVVAAAPWSGRRTAERASPAGAS